MNDASQEIVDAAPFYSSSRAPRTNQDQFEERRDANLLVLREQGHVEKTRLQSNARLPLNSESSLNFVKRVSILLVSVQTSLGALRSQQLTMEDLHNSWQCPSQSVPIPAGTLLPETQTHAVDSNFRPPSETSSGSTLDHPVAKPLSGKKSFTLSHAYVSQMSSITIRYRRPIKLEDNIFPNSRSLIWSNLSSLPMDFKPQRISNKIPLELIS
ncbi:sacI homology domain-containing protein / WW domain-containing protein [Striga asiatica]|uniref:SacI homology domain-containing protein / WW domain-containing protein n=1 Tax=Striga asiatica TaxID=4170 RepID=A0A5A7QDJ1_STRAF|nr:sacI homology domain-containing protein / WW domain-containing protein [Striga asiatica]